MAKKRIGKEDPTGSASGMDYITVQRLSSNVEGRYQKYARIGALAMVPLGCEPTISNINEACKRFFKAEDMECDILAGERGPSWTETSQISNWKRALHVRFIERSEESQMCEKVEIKKTKSEATPEKPARPISTRVVASVPLSAMLKVRKLIQPTVDIVSVQLEERQLLTPATKAFVRRGRLDWPTPPLASSPCGSASPITAYTKSRGTFSPCNSRTFCCIAR